METPPPKKKRGAEENVTAGGKKSKKEEEPKPYVCAIYSQNIASLLPEMQQWRQTSSHSNASLIESPNELPRVKYHRLTVTFASADPIERKEFNSIYSISSCSCDLKDSANELIGQPLFPSNPDYEGVVDFKLYVDQGPNRVVCRVPNLLTEKTAPVMLHFLHDLSQACYEHVEIVPRTTKDADCGFNSLVLEALPSKFELRGVEFGPAGWNHKGQLSDLTVKMASKMRIRFDLLSCFIHNFAAVSRQLLKFVANGRQLDKRLELRGSIHHRDVDQIIKYFERDVPSLKGVIRDVRCEMRADKWSDDWPERCPRAAAQFEERDDGTVEHRFSYANAHSKEPFSLMLLETRHHDERTQIRKFHFTFGSA